MSVPLCDIQKLKAVESNLHVETRGATTLIRVVARSDNAMFYVRMPTAVWREFCKRQLAVPPPLPVSAEKESQP